MANQKLPIIDWTSGKIKELPSVEEKKAFENYCKSKGIEELNIDEFYNTLKDFKNKDKLDYEVVNDKSIDAIKDNFTPPGAKGEEPTAYDLLELSEKVANEKDPIKKQALAGEYLQKRGGKQNALGEWEFEDEHGTYKPTESGRAVYSKLKDEIDTNDNGEIEVDEMADFQKSLDDYASKNKKGREDIPARYRK